MGKETWSHFSMGMAVHCATATKGMGCGYSIPSQ